MATRRHLPALAAAVLVAFLFCHSRGSATGRPAGGLPGISGLAWVEEGIFLAVHDAKSSGWSGETRLSVLQLPQSRDGILWHPARLTLDSGTVPVPLDLESIARIPGTRRFLMLESGAAKVGAERMRRLFQAEVGLDLQTKVTEVGPMPRSAEQEGWNVEGCAAVVVGGRMFLLYGERGEDGEQTVPGRIAWAEMEGQALQPGPVKAFTAPEPTGRGSRDISAMDVDAQGNLYVVSTLDAGDAGPFSSAVWRLGPVRGTGDGVDIPVEKPQLVARLDGLKAESLAVASGPEGPELYVGTDDEFYGGIVRRIRVPADR